MSLLLALLYPIAIQYERESWPMWARAFCAVVALPALVIDVIANYTDLAVLTWDFPRKGEWTFSTRVKRLQYEAGWRGRVGRLVKDYTNFFDPQHDHV